ncbi:MAG: / YhbY domain, partial [Pseudomonadota bacterium]
DRRALTAELCEHSGAEVVQIIGRISVLYRAAKKAVLMLPKA